jgi:hypothetical protein
MDPVLNTDGPTIIPLKAKNVANLYLEGVDLFFRVVVDRDAASDSFI